MKLEILTVWESVFCTLVEMSVVSEPAWMFALWDLHQPADVSGGEEGFS